MCWKSLREDELCKSTVRHARIKNISVTFSILSIDGIAAYGCSIVLTGLDPRA